MRLARAYLRSLNPPLPGAVRNLQAGALVNALGNGLAYPFLFIYLHNVRGIPLDTAGLIVGTNSAVGLVAGARGGGVGGPGGGGGGRGGPLLSRGGGGGGGAGCLPPRGGALRMAVAGGC